MPSVLPRLPGRRLSVAFKSHLVFQTFPRDAQKETLVGNKENLHVRVHDMAAFCHGSMSSNEGWDTAAVGCALKILETFFMEF